VGYLYVYMKLFDIINEVSGTKKNYTFDSARDVINSYATYEDFFKSTEYKNIRRFLEREFKDDWKDKFKELTDKLKPRWTLEKVRDYLKQFNNMIDFRNDSNFNAINIFIYRNGGSELWKELTLHLSRTKPKLLDDKSVTDDLKIQFPQWDFNNVTYYWTDDSRRYLNGLECHIKDENGEEHGVSDNIFVKDLKRRGNGCRKCGVERGAKKRRINVKQWIEKFPKEQGYIFDPSKFYYRTDLHQKTLFVKDIICTKHEPYFIFAENGVNVHNLMNNKSGCPICGGKESQGERKVIYSLNELGYDVSKQKSFQGCFGFKGQNYCDLLKFDAYVVKKDGQEVCVEFDGIQHYEPVELFGGQDALDSLMERDNIKTEYCQKNNIKLIRIPYWEIKNIDNILMNELGYYNKLNESKLLFKKNYNMKLIDTIQDILREQTSNLTVPEQTLLGFLNRFLRGEDGEFQNTPIEQLKKTMLFNSKTIYPMAQKLIEKKNTGKKTYDDKIFNSLFMSMDKSITKEQRYEFFNDGGTITKITYNSQF
jgi:hypothetical protein